MSSNSTGEDPWKLSSSGRIVLTVVFGGILLTGIVGNVLVITLILLVKTMRSAVNLCLASLALADLIILVFLPTIPFLYLYNLDSSSIGKPFCIFVSSIDRGAIVCSTLIFLFVGVERYSALCHPLKTLGLWTRTKVCAMLAVIWTIAVGVSVPYGYAVRYQEFSNQNTTVTHCYTAFSLQWIQWYEVGLYTVAFFLPIPLLMGLYGRMIYTLTTQVPQSDTQGLGVREVRKARSQVIVMLLIVVLIFVVCHMPFKIYVLVYFFDREGFNSMDRAERFALEWFARLILYVNHTANPVIYFSMSANFRAAFIRLFCTRPKIPGGSVGLHASRVTYTQSSAM